MDLRHEAARAAEALGEAATLIVTAGAGMGVDSGLPDFRGDRGFWNAYPMYERLGINFIGAANPEHFSRDPRFGWGFYGHRANLYRSTVPHDGFRIILDWIRRLELSHFVVTSNVDGQFQRAGFPEDRIVEVHGSIHHLQCLSPCSRTIWPFTEEIRIDEMTMRARSIPKCISCHGVARPNILMFGDFSWLGERTARQEEAFEEFIATAPAPVVVLEMGAGTAIPTIRALGERLGRRGARLIRVNPREPQVPQGHVSLPCGALQGLTLVDSVLREKG